MKVLMLDNYDSFTYNLVQILRESEVDFEVLRNDKISPADAATFDKIILSPGPGLPAHAGQMMDIIDHCHATVPMLGICLGHQALGEYFGCDLLNLEEVYHGVQTPIFRKKLSVIFHGLDEEFEAGRYHSWVVSEENIPEQIVVTAHDEEGMVMALEHEDLPLYGVQFHPESIMTGQGDLIIQNFLKS